MIITGALFAEKIVVTADKIDMLGGHPSQFVNADPKAQSTEVPVLLFIQPQPGEIGKIQKSDMSILDTEGAIVGIGPFFPAPNYHGGSCVAVAHIRAEFAKPWHYFLCWGEQRIKGFDVLFADER
ncbi:hypothetical protein ACFROC_25760 [Nocardia tengchongensis]|uniref:hypothetical protein n=1 Tax=Nocardia tengchongensis TaxID=2055889 RepID=UPI0036A79F4A